MRYRLPVTREAAEKAVQEKLGHSSIEAQRAYTRAISRNKRLSNSARKQQQIEALKLKTDELNTQIARQAEMISQLEAKTKQRRGSRKTPHARPATADT